MNNLPKKVKIVEVGPRDGLQNETKSISIEDKLQLIDQLVDAGIRNIEAGSFVNSNWVPQMANSDLLFEHINRHYPNSASLNFTALTPNLKGVMRAIDVGVKEIAVFAAATESFSKKNINCSIDESLRRFEEASKIALKNGLRVRGYISCVAGCPYEGRVDNKIVRQLSMQLLNMGCYEISLGDTIGVATAEDITNIIHETTVSVAVEKVALHLHDTFGQALANVLAGLQSGVSVFDSSVGGLGGCPYAKGATGNIATEDVVYLLNGLGIEHGINIDKLIDAGKSICDKLNKHYPSKAGSALLSKRISS